MSHILVIPSSKFADPTDGTAAKYDFSLGCAPMCESMTDLLAGAFYTERKPAETDESMLQIIPYVLIVVKRAGADALLFDYSRAKGAETRLSAMRSIGVGGHIEQEDSDSDPAQTVMNALKREVREEINVDPGEISIIGLLHDRTNAVGRVHLGVLCVVHIDEDQAAQIRVEGDLVDSNWVSARSVLGNYHHYETWSQFAIEAYVDRYNQLECGGPELSPSSLARTILRRAAYNARRNLAIAENDDLTAMDVDSMHPADLSLQLEVAKSCETAIATLLLSECD